MASARPRQYTAEQAMEFDMNYDSDEMMTMWPHFVCVLCFIVSLLCSLSTLCIVSICLFFSL